MDNQAAGKPGAGGFLMHLAPLGLSHGLSREQGTGSALGSDLSVPLPLLSLVSKDKDVQSWAWHRSRARSLWNHTLCLSLPVGTHCSEPCL